jgi:uncharacterized protein YeaC (DUF1315 family)
MTLERTMDYQQMIDSMSPETYHSLRHSVEVGKWPDGTPLTREQRGNAMQAVIAWGEKHLAESERVGYVDKGHKAGDSCDDPQETTLTWKDSQA